MKGIKGLGGSCESKCGREQTKKPRREGKSREMTATDGAADLTPSCRLQVDVVRFRKRTYKDTN